MAPECLHYDFEGAAGAASNAVPTAVDVYAYGVRYACHWGAGVALITLFADGLPARACL